MKLSFTHQSYYTNLIYSSVFFNDAISKDIDFEHISDTPGMLVRRMNDILIVKYTPALEIWQLHCVDESWIDIIGTCEKDENYGYLVHSNSYSWDIFQGSVLLTRFYFNPSMDK